MKKGLSITLIGIFSSSDIHYVINHPLCINCFIFALRHLDDEELYGCDSFGIKLRRKCGQKKKPHAAWLPRLHKIYTSSLANS
jgi:hypothetical protein